MTRRFADDRIGQEGREAASQIPGLEKRRPIDVLREQAKIGIAEMTPPDELRLHWRGLAAKVQLHLVVTRLLEREHRQCFLTGVLNTNALVVGRDLLEVAIARVVGQQRLRHRYRTRRIRHVNHRPFIVGRDFYCGMGAASGCATNQQRYLALAEPRIALHLFSDMRHLFQRRCDQPRQADDVGVFFFRFGEDLSAGHHHTHVHHLEVITLQNNGDNILADVVHITLHRRNDNFSFGLGSLAGTALFFCFFFFDEGHQMRHRLLHHTR